MARHQARFRYNLRIVFAIAAEKTITMVQELTPKEVKARLDAGEDLMIIDVREEWELGESKLPNIVHIPMDEIPMSLDQIPEDKPVVIVCRTGSRSDQVSFWLEGNGYGNIINLDGGMNAWVKLDPSVGRQY